MKGQQVTCAECLLLTADTIVVLSLLLKMYGGSTTVHSRERRYYSTYVALQRVQGTTSHKH